MEQITDAAWWPIATIGIGFGFGFVGTLLGDRRRNRHERRMRMLDHGLRHGVDFLTAADRVRRWSLEVSSAVLGRYYTKSQDTEQQAAAQQQRTEAVTDAENAYAALRLLLPSAAHAARAYLDLCSAAAYPDEEADQRNAAHDTAERAINDALERGRGWRRRRTSAIESK